MEGFVLPKSNGDFANLLLHVLLLNIRYYTSSTSEAAVRDDLSAGLA